jgi:hypothetical protein
MTEPTPAETPIAGAEINAAAPEPTPEGKALPEAGDRSVEPDMFPRDYVEQLRSEAKDYRLKSARADELEARLHAELTKADGRLADWRDLPFNAEHLTDPEAHRNAITQLLQDRPHYANRVPAPGSSIGQGQQGSPVAPKPGLIDAIRAKQGR